MSTWALSIVLDNNAAHTLFSPNEVKTTIKALSCQFRDRARVDETNIVDANAYVPLHAIIDKLTGPYDAPDMAERVLLFAAKTGNVPALEWAIGKGFRSQRYWAIAACGIAQFDVLEWLHGSRRLLGGLDLTACVIAAAEKGHADVLGWLHARSGDWDADCVAAAFIVAADAQQSAVLNWLFSVFGNPASAQQVCGRAVAKGWVGGAQWAVERGAKVALRPRGLMKVIHGRKSAMLRWLLDGGHVCPDFACIIGATLAREEE